MVFRTITESESERGTFFFLPYLSQKKKDKIEMAQRTKSRCTELEKTSLPLGDLCIASCVGRLENLSRELRCLRCTFVDAAGGGFLEENDPTDPSQNSALKNASSVTFGVRKLR